MDEGQQKLSQAVDNSARTSRFEIVKIRGSGTKPVNNKFGFTSHSH